MDREPESVRQNLRDECISAGEVTSDNPGRYPEWGSVDAKATDLLQTACRVATATAPMTAER